jgi:hypothetical protein
LEIESHRLALTVTGFVAELFLTSVFRYAIRYTEAMKTLLLVMLGMKQFPQFPLKKDRKSTKSVRM